MNGKKVSQNGITQTVSQSFISKEAKANRLKASFSVPCPLTWQENISARSHDPKG